MKIRTYIQSDLKSATLDEGNVEVVVTEKEKNCLDCESNPAPLFY